MKEYLMRKNKEISIDKIISIIFSAIISSFGTHLIKKYIDETTDTYVHTIFKVIILIIAFIAIYNIVRLIISLVKKLIIFCWNSIMNKRRSKSILQEYTTKLEGYKIKISEIKDNYYDKNGKIKENQILNIHGIIESYSDFIYEVIPQKLDNSFWNKATIDMLYTFNRETIISLIRECLDILEDVYLINPDLKIDSKSEERLCHILDEMSTYAD